MGQNDNASIALVKEFADYHSNFDTAFIESLEESLIRYGKLTPRQRAALEKIILKWEIQEWADENL